MTKRIILGSLFVLTACSSEIEERQDAPTSPSTGAVGADVPVTPPSSAAVVSSDREPARGDPSLAVRDPSTTFIPLLTWSFEEASADCNGWPVVGATSAIRAVPAHSGGYSCKVCSNGSRVDLGLTHALGKVEKGHYTLTAWVRKRASTSAPPLAVAQVVANGVTLAVAPAVSVREEWDRVETGVDLAEDAANLEISVGSGEATPDSCLFVDDVTFTRAL